MYDDDYPDDLFDAYSGAAPANENDDDWRPRTRASGGLPGGSKVWIVVLTVVIVAGGAIGVLYYLSRQTNASPLSTTQAFYESLNRREFERTVSYINPSDGISAVMFENSEELIGVIVQLLTGELLNEFGIEVPDFLLELIGDVRWEFRDMTYTLVAETGDQATVQVNGELFLSAMGFEFPSPWNIAHDLVRIDGRWYISLGF